MRPPRPKDWLLLASLTALWAPAPLFGSPASFVVMPLVAAAAALGTQRKRDAVAASLLSLLAVVAGWSALVVARGSAVAQEQLGLAAVVVALHAPVVALLALGAGWARARWGEREASRAREGVPGAGSEPARPSERSIITLMRPR